jgi:hypothetical protein
MDGVICIMTCYRCRSRRVVGDRGREERSVGSGALLTVVLV